MNSSPKDRNVCENRRLNSQGPWAHLLGSPVPCAEWHGHLWFSIQGRGHHRTLLLLEAWLGSPPACLLHCCGFGSQVSSPWGPSQWLSKKPNLHFLRSALLFANHLTVTLSPAGQLCLEGKLAIHCDASGCSEPCHHSTEGLYSGMPGDLGVPGMASLVCLHAGRSGLDRGAHCGPQR